MNSRIIKTIAVLLVAIVVIWAAAFNSLPFLLANLPAETWKLKNSDVIIVLGCSANKDGTPGSMMRERVLTGCKLFKDGVAPLIMFTGAAAHTQFVEANVMSELAQKEGVPAERIILESKARNTAQNAFCSYQVMKERNLKSAVIVTSPQHLLRSNVFFSRYPINYCMYPSGEPDDSSMWERWNFDQREKQYVLNDLKSPKGVNLGLKPEQAEQMPEITRETSALRAAVR